MSVLAALPPVAAAAGKYSWFSDPLSGEVSAPTSSAIGMDVSPVSPESDPLASHKISLLGDYSTRSARPADETDSNARRFASFGLRWQHRVTSRDSISVLAEQGDSMQLRPTLGSNADGSETRATLAWTRELPYAMSPSVTGGVFFGDETARDEAFRTLGRRYFGFSVGGQLRLLESHRPYVSFRVQRNLYDLPGEDSTATGFSRSSAMGDSSRFAAGWRWQASRGLSLQAEASYGINFNNTSDLNVPLERERSRVYFGTRFDFR